MKNIQHTTNKAIFFSALVSLSMGGCASTRTSGAFAYQFVEDDGQKLQQVLAHIEPKLYSERLVYAALPTCEGAPSQDPNCTANSAAASQAHEVVMVSWPDGKELWRASLSPSSRPELLGDVVLVSEKNMLHALDASSGQKRWSIEMPADLTYTGASRSGDVVVYAMTVGVRGGAKRLGRVQAVNATNGRKLWHHEIQGVFGQPLATGGQVLLPWDRQAIVALDLWTGTEITRIRTEDDVYAWLVQDGKHILYGQNAFYFLSEQSAARTKANNKVLSVNVPELPGAPALQEDAYDLKPGTRSSRAKIRIISSPNSDGTGLKGGHYYYLFYRFMFAFKSDGTLDWAQILADDVNQGAVLEQGVVLSHESGAVSVLSHESGALFKPFALGSRVAALSFDISDAGFAASPTAGEGETTSNAEALRKMLLEMVIDPDNRLVPARVFAVKQLAKMDEPEITRDLLDLYVQRSIPRAIKETIKGVLQERVKGASYLVEALSQKYDYLEGSATPPFEAIVPGLIKNNSREALPLLLSHLDNHETPESALVILLEGVLALGDASAVPSLEAFVTRYRADSEFKEKPRALSLAAQAVLKHGGPEEQGRMDAVVADVVTHQKFKEEMQAFHAEASAREAERRSQAEAEARNASVRQRQSEVASRPLSIGQPEINATLAEQSASIRACITEELKRNPGLAQVRVTFVVHGDSGKAQGVGVAPNSDVFVACMKPIVESANFPRFQNLRIRGQYLVQVKERSTSRTQVARITLPVDAPFWMYWKLMSEAQGVEEPEAYRAAWWKKQPRPTRATQTQTTDSSATTAVPATTTQRPSGEGQQTGSGWWSAAEGGESTPQEQPSTTPTPGHTSTQGQSPTQAQDDESPITPPGVTPTQPPARAPQAQPQPERAPSRPAQRPSAPVAPTQPTPTPPTPQQPENQWWQGAE